MKAIILAAGRGERLMPLTHDRPKSLVNLGNGRTVVDEQLEALGHVGVVSRIVLVVGYRAEMIERHVSGLGDGRTEVETLFNPFFATSNNLMSLWLARSEMGTDFLVTNGDNLFTGDVYRDLVASGAPGITLAVCPKRRFDSDDMKVSIANDLVTAIGKTLEPHRCDAESPGLVIVRGRRARQAFREALDRLARRPEAMHQFWLEVFNMLSSLGEPIRPWYFESSGRWQEIDFHADMTRASELIRVKVAALRPHVARRSA